MDERAQAHGIPAVFFAMLITGALLFIIFQPAIDQFAASMLSQTDNQVATDVINERQMIFGKILFYVLFLAVVAFITRSVLQSRSPG